MEFTNFKIIKMNSIKIDTRVYNSGFIFTVSFQTNTAYIWDTIYSDFGNYNGPYIVDFYVGF